MMPQMMGEQIAAAAARMEGLTSLVMMVASGVHVYNVTIIHCGKGKFNVTNIHCGKGARRCVLEQHKTEPRCRWRQLQR